MLYMKEDDMDEMMRKAAENYEVDAERAADWNAVYAAVHESNEPPPEEKKKRRFAFWWLLLIPLGWIAHTEYNKFSHANSSSKQEQKVANTQSKTGIKPEAENQNIIVENNDDSLHEAQNIKADKDVAVNNQHQFLLHQTSKDFRNDFNVDGNKNSHQKKQHDISSATNQSNTQVADNSNKNDALSKDDKAIADDITSSNTPSTQQNITSNNSDSLLNNDVATSSSINQTKNTITDSSTQNKKADTVASKAKSSSVKQTKNNDYHFYGGLIAGGDLSFVKYQQSKAVGYTAGVLVGYKFKKLSIESGVYLDQKNYYTKGDYFDKSKIAYFNDATILNADGYCKMFEIPLNVKYDFSTHKNHTWFATAGFSSYIMNREFYTYDYIKNGTQQHGSRPYLHTTKDWFSVVNLSAGYQLQAGNKTNFRIEPYYKLPISGVGTGNLHITSVGVNLGVTRRIP